MGFNLSEAMEDFIDKIDLDFALVAHPYTLLEQVSLKGGMARCLARNVSVIVGAPFASGIFATGSGPRATYAYSIAPPEIQKKVAAIEAVCAAHNVSLPAAALQFPLAHPSRHLRDRGRSPGERSHGERRARSGAYSCRFLVGPQIEALDRPRGPYAGLTMRKPSRFRLNISGRDQ